QGIYQNLTYPEEAKRAGIEGRVSVQFTVDADGTVSDAMVLRGIGGGADQEAVDAILSTDWLPGVQEGQKVPVRFVYTVQFRLNSDA
ncbi:MAG: energy transducer TonB, partial [Balneolales bacterium]